MVRFKSFGGFGSFDNFSGSRSTLGGSGSFSRISKGNLGYVPPPSRTQSLGSLDNPKMFSNNRLNQSMPGSIDTTLNPNVVGQMRRNRIKSKLAGVGRAAGAAGRALSSVGRGLRRQISRLPARLKGAGNKLMDLDATLSRRFGKNYGRLKVAAVIAPAYIATLVALIEEIQDGSDAPNSAFQKLLDRLKKQATTMKKIMEAIAGILDSLGIEDGDDDGDWMERLVQAIKEALQEGGGDDTDEDPDPPGPPTGGGGNNNFNR